MISDEYRGMEEMSAAQIALRIGASTYSVTQAIYALGIQGKRPLNDRRQIVYPPGTLERVKAYLETH